MIFKCFRNVDKWVGIRAQRITVVVNSCVCSMVHIRFVRARMGGWRPMENLAEVSKTGF